MKLSRRFLSDYLDINGISYREIADRMTSVGNEYASCEKMVDATNLIIGEVVECANHPNSLHLHVCKVNIGKEVLDIVCGAPNVRKGLKVIVAEVGAQLPGGFTIKQSKIRGEVSNGMLCSIQELGIESKFLKKEDIEGICELDENAPVGGNPLIYLNLDDEIIDFELTSNRGDLLSVLGMAYEIGTIYNIPVKDIDLTYPKTSGKMEFNLEINTKKCPLFLAKKVCNVTIKESPNFIKKRLMASGIRPINNIVDISNYVMLETGQPLHFYDADRLGDTIVVRSAFDGEKLVTLDSIERTLTSHDIVIANKSEAIGLAGVMGGLSTEVENDTRNILIESAIFDSISVRLTSKKILRSEASNRFEKGLDPQRTYMAIERSCALLAKYADATVIDDMIIYDTLEKDERIINIKVSEINKLLGLNISQEEIVDIYNRLGFKVEESDDLLTVTVPTRRLDISIKEDLIEEVSRIYGMDKIEGTLPVLPIKKGSYNKFERLIRDKMINLGLNETLSYTLIPNSEVHKYTLDSFEEINLLDPMSDDRKTLRYSLLPSLMMIYDYNNKRNNKDVCIFELGKSFGKIDGNYTERKTLACLMSGVYTEGLNKEKITFYHIKGILEELLDSLGFNGRYTLMVKNLPNELHPGSSALVNLNGSDIGYIGKVHPNLCKDDVYVMELNLDLVEKYHTKSLEYKEISKYPNVVKDLAFIVNDDITNEMLVKEIKKSAGKYLVNIELFDLYKGEKLQDNQKSLAYNLTFNDKDNTLTDDVVMPIFNKVIDDITKKFNAVLRDK